MVKTLSKSSSLKPAGWWPLNLVHIIREDGVGGVLQSCSNDDPGLTFTYLIATLLPNAFIWENA